MSNFEHSRQEHTEEPDSGIEMVDLEPSEPTDTLDKFKRDLLAWIEKKHSARPFLLKHGKVHLAALSGIVLVGLIVVLSASGTFSFLLQVHNKALVQVLHTLLSLPDTNDINVSWRPDGRVLAMYNAGHVDIYDCATGRKLSSLVPATSPDRMNGIEDVLRWSPDGTHLLLFRIDWGPMQLWGPGQLPK